MAVINWFRRRKNEDMKPYYEDNHTTIYHADCREILKDLNYNYAFTSPPYNMHLRVNAKKDGYVSRGAGPRTIGKFSQKYENYTDDLPIDEYYTMCKTVIDELLKKSRLLFWNIQLVTGNKPAIMRLMGNYEQNIKEIIIWDKQRVAPSSNAHIMNSRYEFIWILAPKKDCFTRTFEGFTRKYAGFDNLISISPMGKSISEHGATMPIALPQTIFKHFANKKDVIVDPFMGAGTTLRAAKNLNIKSIGIEIDEKYCELAAKRMAQEVLPL